MKFVFCFIRICFILPALCFDLKAAVIYSETFPNSGSANAGMISSGWTFAYNDAGASVAGNPSGSDSVQVPVVSNAGGSDGNGGYVYVPTGTNQPYKEEILLYAEDLSDSNYTDINSISFYVRNSDPADGFSIALKIDGNWYVSDVAYGSSTDAWTSYSIDPMVGTTWKALTVNVGSQPLAKGSVASLPASGTLESIGFYLSPIPPVGRTRFDTLVVDITPGPGFYEDWGGMTPDSDGFINTGGWLGWLYVAKRPWFWSYSLERWIVAIDPGPQPGGAWFYLTAPVAAVVETPTISPNGGTFSSTQSVSLSTSTSGATIRYTTDGSTPSQSHGTVYTGTISVSSNTTLKAIAYKNGVTDSVVASAIFTIATGSGNAYYVDPSIGSMSNPGTASEPWSTLQAVFSAGKTFQSGDTIYLRSGNHGLPVITADNAEDVIITRQAGHTPIVNQIHFNGATHWLIDDVDVYTSDAPPDPPVLEHPVYAQLNNSLFRITSSSSYITVRNCRVYSIENASSWSANDWNYKAWNGIYMDSNSHHLTIDGCDVKNTNFGIHMHGSTRYITIKNSEVQHFCGDALRANCDDLVIENNYIHDAYDTNGNHDDIIQGFSTSNVVIRGNIILNATTNRSLISGAQAIGAFDGWFDNWVVENNIIASRHWNGITLLGARNCRIVNNTVIHNPIGSGSATPWIQIGAHKNGTASSGNFCLNNLASNITGLSGTTASNNIKTTDYTSHFVDYNGFDFHLKSTSSAIGAGTSSQAPSTDFEGELRSDPPDVGADEF